MELCRHGTYPGMSMDYKMWDKAYQISSGNPSDVSNKGSAQAEVFTMATHILLEYCCVTVSERRLHWHYSYEWVGHADHRLLLSVVLDSEIFTDKAWSHAAIRDARLSAPRKPPTRLDYDRVIHMRHCSICSVAHHTVKSNFNCCSTPLTITIRSSRQQAWFTSPLS